jgi:hypothetical protein
MNKIEKSDKKHNKGKSKERSKPKSNRMKLKNLDDIRPSKTKIDNRCDTDKLFI